MNRYTQNCTRFMSVSRCVLGGGYRSRRPRHHRSSSKRTTRHLSRQPSGYPVLSSVRTMRVLPRKPMAASPGWRDVGSRIGQGEAIARIDAEDLRLDLADSEAQLASLKSQLKYRDSSLQRLQRLADSNNAAATQLDEAQSQLDMTRQEIKRAEVAVAQIKRRISANRSAGSFPRYRGGEGRTGRRVCQPRRPGRAPGRYRSPGNQGAGATCRWLAGYAKVCRFQLNIRIVNP